MPSHLIIHILSFGNDACALLSYFLKLINLRFFFKTANLWRNLQFQGSELQKDLKKDEEEIIFKQKQLKKIKHNYTKLQKQLKSELKSLEVCTVTLANRVGFHFQLSSVYSFS